MKNSIYALGLHIISVVLCFILVIAITKISHDTKIDILNDYKWIIVLIVISIYPIIALPLKASKSLANNFFAGSLITIFGLAIWWVSLSQYNGNLLSIDYPNEEFWIVLYTYLLPIKLFLSILKIEMQPLISLLMCFLPSILIGICLSIKYRIIEIS
tara:strand:+ start:380 stop:850 length:471 start_codon:yes stop_codon:yes gene_type:complete